MTIDREIIINGESQNTKYELTGIELEHAYNEYVETKNKNEVIHHLKDLEYEDIDGIPEDIISDLASQMQEKLDNARDEIILKLIHDNEELLKPYKEKWKVFSKEVTLTLTHEYTIKAKSKEQADKIFESWAESNAYQMTEDLCEDAQWNGDFDYGYTYEDDSTNPDYADISEEDI